MRLEVGDRLVTTNDRRKSCQWFGPCRWRPSALAPQEVR